MCQQLPFPGDINEPGSMLSAHQMSFQLSQPQARWTNHLLSTSEQRTGKARSRNLAKATWQQEPRFIYDLSLSPRKACTLCSEKTLPAVSSLTPSVHITLLVDLRTQDMAADLQLLPRLGPSHQDRIHLLSLHTQLVSNAHNSWEGADFLSRTKV